jgi:hypothetical protein
MFSEVLIIQVKLLQSTIREFSSIADKEVVKRIYLKTMQKLLAVTQKATKAENSRDSNSMRIDDSSNDSRLAFFSLYCFVFLFNVISHFVLFNIICIYELSSQPTTSQMPFYLYTYDDRCHGIFHCFSHNFIFTAEQGYLTWQFHFCQDWMVNRSMFYIVQ